MEFAKHQMLANHYSVWLTIWLWNFTLNLFWIRQNATQDPLVQLKLKQREYLSIQCAVLVREKNGQFFLFLLALVDMLLGFPLFFRDIYLLRTSNRFLAWPWSSLTAWRFGRRMTWRRQRAYFNKVEQGKTTTTTTATLKTSQQASVCPIPSEEASHGPDPTQISLTHSTMIALTSRTIKCHAICLRYHRKVLPVRTFSAMPKASPVAFCMQCGPKCPDWGPHRGGHGAAFLHGLYCRSSPSSEGLSASSPLFCVFILFRPLPLLSNLGKD